MEGAWGPAVPASSPAIKLEASPMDSLLSEPSGVYPSLFSGSTVASSAAATPTDTGIASMDLVFDDGDNAALDATAFSAMSPVPGEAPENTTGSQRGSSVESTQLGADASATGDKKPAKKRKSWGQVLPEPKTNLPPRKRAKTEDEKEQRRVERVLRNRRAAQSSRERKRLEVEALERRNQDLEEQLRRARRENLMLYQQLAQAQGKPAALPAATTPVTLSQELFSSQSTSTLGSFLASQTAATINPVSLSPTLHPVPDTVDLVSAVGTPQATECGATSEPAGCQSKPVLSSQERGHAPSTSSTVSVGGGVSSADRLAESHTLGHGSVLPDDPVADALFHGDFSVLPPGDPDSFVLESGYLDSPESGNSDFNYLADNDAVAAISGSDFNIDDFLNPDGANQLPTGGNFDFGDSSLSTTGQTYHYSSAQAAAEDSDLQPHAGASLEGCDDAGIAVGMF